MAFIPTTPGGTIASEDSDDLSNVSVIGLPPGTTAWNSDVDSYFKLTISNASLVTDEILAVNGITGLRWIIVSGSESVESVTAQTANAVNNTDAANPVVKDASASNAGTMSAANFVKLADLDYDGWFKTQVDLMHAQAPALTNFREIKPGGYPLGTLTLSDLGGDPKIVGGGFQNAGNTGIYNCLGNTIFQTPKSTSWAIAFRVKLAAPNASEFYFAGLANSGLSCFIGIAVYPPTDATNYLLRISNASTAATTVATSVADDGAYHNVVMTFDGTTIKQFIDGTLSASQATLTEIADTAVTFVVNGPTAGNVKVARFAYGYIAP